MAKIRYGTCVKNIIAATVAQYLYSLKYLYINIVIAVCIKKYMHRKNTIIPSEDPFIANQIRTGKYENNEEN